MYRIEYHSFSLNVWVSCDSYEYATLEEAEAALKLARTQTTHSYRITEIGGPGGLCPEPVEVDSKIAFAAKKVPLMMIALKSCMGAARVFGYGRKKHGPGNYLLATLADGAAERYLGALLRHVAEMQNLNGLWERDTVAALDEESGLPHIDHAIATLVMLRAILVREDVLPQDPGEGNEPPVKQ